MVIVGILFQRTWGWGATIADGVEPALQPLYERFYERGRRRERLFWTLIFLGLIPFGMALADRYAGVPLQWPIAAVNLLLCGLYVFSMIRSQRYYAGLYAEAYAAHLEKLRSLPTAAR